KGTDEMKNIFVLIGFFSLSVFAQSENCHHTLKTFFCVEYVKNYDGDTITVTIPYLHPLFGKEIPIRLSGIDTAELTGKHPCEKKMAKIAKNYLGHRLKKAKPERIELREISRDKYFRILAEVW